MKFIIKKNILIENLLKVSKAISTKTIIPILNGIKFELKEEGLYLTATDSELIIESFIPSTDIIETKDKGIMVIQNKFLIDVIRKMPGDEINFEVIDGLHIQIYNNNSQYKLNCFDPKEYPNNKIETNKKTIKIASKILKEAISQTSFAVSNQESRPLLTGVNIKINGDILEFVATDSYRLAKKTIILDKSFDEDVNIVIPGKNIIELEKILEQDEDVNINFFSNKITFIYKNIKFEANLLSGSYPNTSSLIPSDFEIILDINSKEFYESIDRAALLSQAKEKNIIKLELKDKEMKISSYASEIGKVEDKMLVSQNNNKELDISFSAKYMMDAIKTIKSEKILVLFISDIKPIILKSPESDELIQLILPIKTY